MNADWTEFAGIALASVAALLLLTTSWRYWWAKTVSAVGAGHTEDQMPKVMAGRYAFMAVMIVAFAALGDFRALGVLFSGFALLGLLDSKIYADAEKPVAPHMQAALFSILVAALCGAIVLGR